MNEKNNIIYVSDLMEALKSYLQEYGDDRVIVDKQTKEQYLGADDISRLVQIPDWDLDDTGYYCKIILKKGDWDGREF